MKKKSLGHYLRSLYAMSAQDVVRRSGRLISRQRGQAGERYSLDYVLESPKEMRSQRMFDFLNRYQIILGRHLEWPEIDFAGARVLEIGPGPLSGWGPLAVFLGAESYVGLEPMFNLEVIRAAPIVEKYFLPHYKDLVAVFGPRMSFDRFVAEMEDRIHIQDQELLKAHLDGPFDLILSNSCLEHVHPLQESLLKIRRAAAPGVRFLHVVDFGNHQATRNPFEGLYRVEPEEYLKKHGRSLNLWRAPDVLDILNQTGFEARMAPYYYFREFFEDKICPYWRERYTEDDLFLKVALFVEA